MRNQVPLTEPPSAAFIGRRQRAEAPGEKIGKKCVAAPVDKTGAAERWDQASSGVV
jgi:hypothetical protein